MEGLGFRVKGQRLKALGFRVEGFSPKGPCIYPTIGYSGFVCLARTILV